MQPLSLPGKGRQWWDKTWWGGCQYVYIDLAVVVSTGSYPLFCKTPHPLSHMYVMGVTHSVSVVNLFYLWMP